MDEQKPPDSDVEYENEYSDIDDNENPVSRMDYIRSVVPPPKPKKLWPRIAGILVLVCVLGGAIYLLAPHIHFDQNKKPKSNSSLAISHTAAGQSSAPTAAYVSNGNDLNLTFNYPQNWSVSPPTEGNPDDQPITVKSPSTSLSVGGKQETVQVVVLIRPGSSNLSELGSGMATAALASTQFSYSQPTPTQDKFPYLTYINITGGSAASGTFEEVVDSGSQQLQQGTSITPSSLAVDPIITAAFYECATSSCQSESPLPITSVEWRQDNIFVQSMSLIESLEFN